MRISIFRAGAGLLPALAISSILLIFWLADPVSSRNVSELAQTGVFELALPETEFNIAPTKELEIPIPSSNVNLIDIHILSPFADRVDYGQINVAVNGEGAAGIYGINRTERGKVVRIDLGRLPGFRLKPGRNSVEISVNNDRGGTNYSSFVLSTTSNRLKEFNYQTFAGSDQKQKIPPEIALFEPEGEIVFPSGRRSMEVAISGVATAVNKIAKLTIQGTPVNFATRGSTAVRKLGLPNESNSVTFDFRYSLTAQTTSIRIEATDIEGNRTQLQIPVSKTDQSPIAEFRGQKYALLVGISRFRNPNQWMQNLRYADKDATDLHKYLQTAGGGSFAPGNMLLLTNEQATLGKFRQSLSEFVAKPGPDDLLIIFLATHGGPDPLAPQNKYFVLHDTVFDRISDTGLPMPDLQNYLQQNVRAKRMLLLVDTCESAGLLSDPSVRPRGPINNLSNIYLEKLLYGEEGRAIITASDINESSLEGSKWGEGHGVFTYYLLEGMHGKADENSDRLVTVGELFRFVRRQVRIDTKFNQNPRLLIGTNENLKIAAVMNPR